MIVLSSEYTITSLEIMNSPKRKAISITQKINPAIKKTMNIMSVWNQRKTLLFRKNHSAMLENGKQIEVIHIIYIPHHMKAPGGSTYPVVGSPVNI